MNRFPKFKKGDRVQTEKLQLKGTVESFHKTDDVYRYRITLDSGILSTYDEEALSFTHDDLQEKVKDITDKVCPKCSNEWKVTKFGSRVWYDCDTCGKTAEELCNEKKSTYTSKKDDSEWDQDFGYYYPGIGKP